ncbi:hypothetical protein EMMF5_005633 [Cystobasidiomycetes sp. EMM_F5]
MTQPVFLRDQLTGQVVYDDWGNPVVIGQWLYLRQVFAHTEAIIQATGHTHRELTHMEREILAGSAVPAVQAWALWVASSASE